VSELASRN